ncbi:MAG: acyl-CoA thioesterase [Alphaproteobacteria bacterium]|nr:acyl-CoA thioesterase [Alphaproteobacteria bacterium]MBO6629689.1 acyl-CoA thioesterase [Alphaproteobacteria bacterium]MDF1625839.1 thioesterase family protein [Parvibaculaceae bacterium]
MSKVNGALPQAEALVQVPFHDVDLMAVAWHGHYLKYFEIGRGALLDVFSYNYQEMKDSGYAWPVVDVHLRYVKPARLGQKLRVTAMLKEYDLRLKINYLITDALTGEKLTKGHTIMVPVDIETGELYLGTPKILLDKLGIDE